MTSRRILVIDGNVAEIRARLIAMLGYDSGNGYARVLRRIDSALQIDIVTAADGEAQFPSGVALADYDGVTMTGSALNIYNGGAPVTRQIELAKSVFAAGVPFFGSCWGLQVAVTATCSPQQLPKNGTPDSKTAFASSICRVTAGPP